MSNKRRRKTRAESPEYWYISIADDLPLPSHLTAMGLKFVLTLRDHVRLRDPKAASSRVLVLNRKRLDQNKQIPYIWMSEKKEVLFTKVPQDFEENTIRFSSLAAIPLVGFFKRGVILDNAALPDTQMDEHWCNSASGSQAGLKCLNEKNRQGPERPGLNRHQACTGKTADQWSAFVTKASDVMCLEHLVSEADLEPDVGLCQWRRRATWNVNEDEEAVELRQWRSEMTLVDLEVQHPDRAPDLENVQADWHPKERENRPCKSTSTRLLMRRRLGSNGNRD
ncbi:hypothetical protein DL96DRAFT_1563611 [Flagelloscypha sp. PMI_526]|nr:hypothetical protein DL96DRAFT_1563611 [Flagelloscypha sp. PMI_526]